MHASLANDPVIQHLIGWAAACPLVRAMLLTSTRALPHGHTDALSDYDVILIMADIAPFVDDRRWLEDFGAVLVAYWDPVNPDPEFGIDVCGNVTQYANGLKIDFTLWSVALFQQIVAAPALPAELDAGYQILLDKDNLAAHMRPPTGSGYAPTPPTEAFFQTQINDFLSDAPYVAKCLWRDELLPAKWCLDTDMKHLYLRQMLEWRVALDHNWAASISSLGKGLKKHLPPATWAALEATYVGADPAENWQALERTLALYRAVAMDVGAALGYSYPEELHQRVRAYVEQIKRLPPP